MRNGNPEQESFDKLFECWLVEQNKHLQQLISAANNKHDDSVLRRLVDQVIRHYEEYYQAKSIWAKEDVLSMFSPSWRSTLEDAFLWIGGWRPTMAFHLLYSKSGLQLEAKLADLMRGFSTGDLGDLSSAQLTKIDELHQNTVREEKVMTENFAKHQEMVADTSMVELSNVVSELIRSEENGGDDRMEESERRVESTVDDKAEGMGEILRMADGLRLRTLKEVVLQVLTPIQGVHFLIAAAELHLRLHDWGKKRDGNASSARSHSQDINSSEQHNQIRLGERERERK